MDALDVDLSRIGIKQPRWKELTDLDSARRFCEEVPYVFIFLTKRQQIRQTTGNSTGTDANFMSKSCFKNKNKRFFCFLILIEALIRIWI
jgi:hypothetical protein